MYIAFSEYNLFSVSSSSPQTQRRFVFGASSEVGIQNPEFGRLETQGGECNQIVALSCF